MTSDTSRELESLTYILSCQDVLAEMVHTRDGSRLVREFIARGSAKVMKTCTIWDCFTAHVNVIRQDRKQIVKGIKPYVERMSQEELAQLVLFSAFDIIESAVSSFFLPEFSHGEGENG